MSQIDNVHGAVSYVNGVKSTIEEEIAHTETSKMQVTQSVTRLRTVAVYLEELSGKIVGHGLRNDKEQMASTSAMQVALSINSVYEKVDELQEEFKSLIPLLDIVIQQIQAIAEGS